VLLEGIDRLRRRSTRDAPPIPLPFPALADALGGGLWPGLYVVAGPIASGKTQLLCSLALHAAQNGIETAVHTPAAAPAETSARLLGLSSFTAWSSLFVGDTPVDDAQVERLTSLPLEVVAAPSNPDKRLMVTDRLKAPLDRSGSQTIVAAVDGVLTSRPRVVAEAAPCDLLDHATIDPELANAADGVLVIVPLGPIETGVWRTVRIGLAKLRHGVPRWCDLRFNGTWFEEEEDEIELSIY
jgi:RecA/RadA recombinase